MDITRGDFEDFSPISSSRSQRPETRSSVRSEMTCSMEILPPEENFNGLFMNEEVSETEESCDDTLTILGNSSSDSQLEQITLHHDESSDRNNTEDDIDRSSASSGCADNFADFDDPKLKMMIEKMKKYDRILIKKVKREKEVKRQRLLFQKQMLKELSSASETNEATANMAKYLALMPPSGQLQELLDSLDKDEFVPIFPTQINFEESRSNTRSPRSASASQFDSDETSNKSKSGKTDADENSKQRSQSAKSERKGKIDFIKRNIELAKDAGNYISMTDDEKKRLGELLSDLDQLENVSSLEEGVVSYSQLSVGEGYMPDDDQMKRLAEIDERIQALIPSDEFEMICGTPNLSEMKFENQDIASLGKKIYFGEIQDISYSRIEEIQQRLDNIDEEFKAAYQGTTPRLTNEQLQKLLDECSISSTSRLSYRSKLSSSSSDYQNSSRPETQTSILAKEMEDDTLSDVSLNSVRPVLTRETLDSLLDEAKSCLGVQDSTSSRTSEEGDINENIKTTDNFPLFQNVTRKQLPDSHLPAIVLEEVGFISHDPM